MDLSSNISPFSWIEHDDGNVSVTLYASEKYKKKLFITRKKDRFWGSGYDWDSLATVFIQEKMPDLRDTIRFDSEQGMFCAYSSDIDALKSFISEFKTACENDDLISDIFSRAIPEEPITKEDMRSAFNKMMNIDKE